MPVIHFYRYSEHVNSRLWKKINAAVPSIVSCESEICFNVEINVPQLTDKDEAKLLWLFGETYEMEKTQKYSYLDQIMNGSNYFILEVGPRLAFTTAWSSNCASICKDSGITSIGRIEKSNRYLFSTQNSSNLSPLDMKKLLSVLHDRMTECIYQSPLKSFLSNTSPTSFGTIPVMEQGRSALEKFNKEKGLGFDDWDIDFYTSMFLNQLKRNPTDVECFDLGQSNSEHSRHWFFGGKLVIDGVENSSTLFSLVKSTLPEESNSVIAFHDNSSVRV